MSSRHVAEIRRRILVENPIIVRFMKKAIKTEKLVAQLTREYVEMRDIIKYVRNIDKQTAKNLSVHVLGQDFPKKAKAKAKAKASRPHVNPVAFENVIQFPRQKKSTKAA